ncbi:MAG TPA: hypothetical protein VL286_03865 [Rhizomicrobium sp.]|jgi:hypothetical protein|nr:hypothetical protein [Rhizomicrobium sp.]
MKTMLMLSVLAGGAVLCTSAMAAHDNFDRADLGNKWVVVSPNLYISNNQLKGDSLALGYDKKSASDTTVKATLFLNGTDLEYGAVASGNIASGNNAFVKLQEQNGSGEFEYGGFYVGNNGGGNFFQLNSPVPSPATLTLSFCGTVATMKIKSAAGTQKYTYDYGTTFGTGGGLGTYGNISLDDYKSKLGGCADAVGATVIKGSNARDLSLVK